MCLEAALLKLHPALGATGGAVSIGSWRNLCKTATVNDIPTQIRQRSDPSSLRSVLALPVDTPASALTSVICDLLVTLLVSNRSCAGLYVYPGTLAVKPAPNLRSPSFLALTPLDAPPWSLSVETATGALRSTRRIWGDSRPPVAGKNIYASCFCCSGARAPVIHPAVEICLSRVTH